MDKQDLKDVRPLVPLNYNKAESILKLSRSHQDLDLLLHRLKHLQLSTFERADDDLVKLALENIFGDAAANISETDETLASNRLLLREHVIEELTRLDPRHLERYLKYRYAYEVFPLEKRVGDFPPVVQIEPTSQCNFRCVFCYQTDKDFTKKSSGHMGSMSMNLFTDIVDQLEGNVEGITLASRGEPTLNRNLHEMLRYLSGKFIAIKINTNAQLLSEELSHVILQSGIQTLVFSADAMEESSYKAMRVNGDFSKVRDNIIRFNEIRKKFYPNSEIITRVSGVYYNDNQNFTEMERFWGAYVDQVAFVAYNPWENTYASTKNKISAPCSDLWRRMFIWWDGRVSACDVDYKTTLALGSVTHSSVTDIWNGEAYRTLREKHLNRQRQDIDICSRCALT